MHLAANPEQAFGGNLPFHYTACGRTAPLRELTDNVEVVTCLACRQAAAEAGLVAAGHQPSAAHSDPFAGAMGGDAEELPAATAAEGGDLFSEVFIVEEPVDEDPAEDDGKAMIRDMLMGIIEGQPLPERARRWLIESAEDDPEGILDIIGDQKLGHDVRDSVPGEYRERLIQLTGLLGMVEAESVGIWLLSIVDRLASDSMKWRAIAGAMPQRIKQEERERYSAELARIRREKGEELQQAEGQHSAAMEALKDEHSTAVETLRSQHIAEMESLRATHREQLAAARAEGKNEGSGDPPKPRLVEG